VQSCNTASNNEETRANALGHARKIVARRSRCRQVTRQRPNPSLTVRIR
jgi:hypothetical protein